MKGKFLGLVFAISGLFLTKDAIDHCDARNALCFMVIMILGWSLMLFSHSERKR